MTALELERPGGQTGRKREGGESVRVLLVDPSPLSRSCLLAGFSENATISITGCGHLEELGSDPPPEGDPEVVILQAGGQDIGSREFGERLKTLTQRFPGAATMLLSGPHNVAQMLHSLQLGVGAYITGDVALAPTIAALQLMREGLIIYPRAVLANIFGNGVAAPKAGSAPDMLETRAGDTILTPRQLDVLRLLARGLSNKAIASQLDISESTVKVHIRAIMERTGMLNRTQIVAHFFREWQ